MRPVRGVPETKYARADDGVYLAYQAFGLKGVPDGWQLYRVLGEDEP
jgi:hypothetical protein